MEKFIENGKALGLTGVELRTFVDNEKTEAKNRIDEERTERIRIREIEAESQKVKLDWDRLKIEAERVKFEFEAKLKLDAEKLVRSE